MPIQHSPRKTRSQRRASENTNTESEGSVCSLNTVGSAAPEIPFPEPRSRSTSASGPALSLARVDKEKEEEAREEAKTPPPKQKAATRLDFFGLGMTPRQKSNENLLDLESPTERAGPSRPIASNTVTKRARGRPPTTGEYVGLAEARRQLNAAEERELELRAERETADTALLLARDQWRSPADSPLKDTEDPDPLDAMGHIKKALDSIIKVSKVSKGLKGQLAHTLKVAAGSIEKSVTLLATRSESDETKRLSSANERMARDMEELKRKVETLQAVQRPHTPPPQPTPPIDMRALLDKIRKEIRAEVGSAFDLQQRASEKESRHRRRSPSPHPELDRTWPALAPPRRLPKRREGLTTNRPQAVSQRTPAAAFLAPAPNIPAVDPLPPTSAAQDNDPRPQRQKKSARTERAPKVAPSPAAAPPTEAPLNPPGEEWVRVTRRRRKGKTQKAQVTPVNKEAPKKPKLRAPQSTAVLIKLQPGAAERGITYDDVFAEAKSKIDLEGLGIATGVRYKRAASGARLLAIPGATSGLEADALAEQLRAKLKAEDVIISRPTKCVDARVSGLDDSTTAEERVTAVARTGNCPREQVRCGPIRRSFNGLRTAVVSCPIAAAKRLVGKRLLVGWVSAQFKVLLPRPQRCYKCFQSGHLAAKCTAEADYRNTCMRCGQAGHLAAACAAPPHCMRCAAADKAADHRIGGSACNSSPKKDNKRKGAKGKRAQTRPRKPTATADQATAGVTQVEAAGST